MADDNISKQEFSIRNLSTRSVTLYPQRAHVVRDINDITLKVSYPSHDRLLSTPQVFDVVVWSDQ